MTNTGPEAMGRPSDLPARGLAAQPAPKVAALARGAADALCLAATPVFAFCAVLALPAGEHGMHAMADHGGAAGGSMALMYLLMSAAHAGAWLRLVAGERPGR
ncbi:hypothetical protein [Acuticoccus kandeliae]|uniref:hypothetical protein n=1 Tax=Acuticoccus kandeliae TaxID=2073160 RepID=UPI00196A27EB|nr:hypothetical protein [Acuticoccus kandeliae]